MAPTNATRKLSSGTPPTATQRTSGATDWLMASRPQGKANGHRSRSASTSTHQPATAAGQPGSRSSSRWPMQNTAKMTDSAPASANHPYHATLISHDSSGTNSARPKTSPQANDPRRLRPASATTSSAGPTAASGQASTGGNEADTAAPPATDSSSAQRVAKPPNAPGRPGGAPGTGSGRTACTAPSGSPPTCLGPPHPGSLTGGCAPVTSAQSWGRRVGGAELGRRVWGRRAGKRRCFA